MYHTGSGSTRTICEILRKRLSTKFEVELFSIFKFDIKKLTTFDFIVLGFPSYHCRPSISMMEFVERLPPLKIARNAVLLTTYGLYPGNSIRTLVKELIKKNIITVGYTGIRGPASDGVLMYPEWISFMFNYERAALCKISNLLKTIERLIDNTPSVKDVQIPWYKWYVPLNNILRIFGERNYEKYKNSISLVSNKCSSCGLCIENCGRHCWTYSVDKYPSEKTLPVFDPNNCEFCLKCVHNCQSMAINFSNKMSEKTRLNKAFYSSLKNDLLK